MSITYTVDKFDNVVVRGKFPTGKIAALRESIQKWKWLVKYLDKHPDKPPPFTSTGTCSLCKIFIMDDCIECPVFQRTKRGYCEHTPYRKYSAAREEGNYVKACKYVREEVKFLESLLPPKSPK